VRFAKFVMFGASALIALSLIVGCFMRSTWDVERSITMRAEPSRVQALIGELEHWPEWMPWSKERDASVAYAVNGHGVGAELAWNGKKLGRNRVTLTSVDPARGVEYEMSLNGSEHPGHGSIRLESTGAGPNATTTVVWHESGDVGWNPIYRMLVALIEPALARDFDRGLERLKTLAEAHG